MVRRTPAWAAAAAAAARLILSADAANSDRHRRSPPPPSAAEATRAPPPSRRAPLAFSSAPPRRLPVAGVGGRLRAARFGVAPTASDGALRLPRRRGGASATGGFDARRFASPEDDIDRDDGDGNAAENNVDGVVDGPSTGGDVRREGAERAPEPPRFLALAFDAAALANAAAGLILLRNIESVGLASSASNPASDVLLASTRHRRNLSATYVAGALGHLLLAGGSCRILSGATRTRRLRTSDGTYRRLATGALVFGTLGLLGVPGEAGCATSSSPTAVGVAFLAVQCAKAATAAASFVGWEYGAGGFGAAPRDRLKNAVREIAGGCKRVWRTLPVTDERPATFYRTSFVLLTLGNVVFNVPELWFNLQQGAGLFSLPVSLTISSVARLALLSAITYVLKDASERKRLEGSTFVKLNILVGLWAFGVGIAQGYSDGVAKPFNTRRAADKLLFGLLFLNNGILSLLFKMGIISKRDEDDPDGDPPLRVML